MTCVEMDTLRLLYLDHELDPAAMLAFEAHLRDCPQCREAMARERAFSQSIRQEARHFRAPIELRDRIRRDLSPAKPSPLRTLRYLGFGWNPVAIAASLLLTFIASSALTTSYLGATADDQLVSDIISSHVRSLMAGHLTDVASSDQHTVKPWFMGKVDASPPAVDLAAVGFPLIGGRLDYVDRRPCAALVYRHDKHVINVLVWAGEDSDGTATAFYSKQGYNLVHFTADNLTYWAVSDLNHAELRDFVDRLVLVSRSSDA